MRVQFQNILCATDFSDFSNHTVKYGVALAKEFEARLIVCHVIDLSSVAIYGEFQLDPIGQQNRIIEDADAQLQELTGDQPVEWAQLAADRLIGRVRRAGRVGCVDVARRAD